MKSAFTVFFVFTIFTAAGAAPWKRHTIDNSSRGADGVRLADVNGDGLPDIATGWEEGGMIRAYLHPGKGTVKAPWPAVTVGEVRSPEDAVFADLDGDGAADVVSSCEGGTRCVFVHWAPRERARYLDSGAWRTEPIPATRGGRQWMFAFPLDIDGRGGIDLVVGSKGKDAIIGWLQSPEDPRDLAAWKLHPLREAGWIMSLRPEDLDGDGDLDVLASDRKGSRRGVLWLENPGPSTAAAGTRWREHEVDLDIGEVMFLTRADLDRDGRNDILAAVRGKGIAWLRATGNNDQPWERREIGLPERCGTGKAVEVGDIDLDGRMDVVFSCENARGGKSGLRWLSCGGSPGDSGWMDHEISGPEGVKFDRMELLDLDGDGDLDVLTCEEAENLGVIWYENPKHREEKLAAGRKQESRPPNILLILADDLGYECLGAYGGTSYKTPHLDALAQSGIRFTNCFSHPVCSPSRVTLLTGRYTFRTTEEWGFIPPGEVTFGQVLARAGYATAFSGKWQLGLLREDPLRVKKGGFQENCTWAWHEGPRYWKPMIYRNGTVRGDVADRYGPDVFCDFLIDFMERNRERPFLAYYGMVLSHFPKKDEPKGPRGRWETYVEMVENMDNQVGKLVAAVERLGLRQKTVIVFTGDNGTPKKVVSKMGDRSIQGGKGKLTDAGTRVPLIASWPGTAPAGTVKDDLIDFTDFLPTLAELAGMEAPQDITIDGHSFAPQLAGKPGNPRRWVYTQWEGKRWIRNRRWKLYGNGKLFDMHRDPEENSPITPEGDTGPSRAIRALLHPVLENFKRP